MEDGRSQLMAIVSEKVTPFEEDLYRYLNSNEIDGFEDQGRTVAIKDMPKTEDIFGIPVGAEYPSFVTFREDLVRPNFETLSRQRLKDFQEIKTQNAGFFLKIISLTSMSTRISGSHQFLVVGEFSQRQKRNRVRASPRQTWAKNPESTLN